MGHGLPDGTLSGKTKTVYALLDMAELAVRLGSPVNWDRLGNVVLFDDFSHGICKGIVYEALDDDAVTLHTGESISGPYSVQAHACGDDGNMAGMYYQRGLPVLGGVGLQFSFGIHIDTQYIMWTIEQDDGTDTWRGAVRYDWQNKRLERQTAWDAWTPFATGVTASEFSTPFNTGKLTVNFATHKLIRFRMNEGTFGVDGFPMFRVDSLGAERLSVWGVHVSKLGATADVKLDAFIVTQNEP